MQSINASTQQNALTMRSSQLRFSGRLPLQPSATVISITYREYFGREDRDENGGEHAALFAINRHPYRASGCLKCAISGREQCDPGQSILVAPIAGRYDEAGDRDRVAIAGARWDL